MRRWQLLVCGALGACASTPASVGTIGDLEHAIPAGWHSNDRSVETTALVVWTPPEQNLRKESIAVFRTRALDALTKRGLDPVSRLLGEAQRALPSASGDAPVRFVTKHGFTGARVTVRFVPEGQTETYRRVHAVLLDGTSLVHVLHTARIDGDQEAFEIVLDSLHRKEG